jgi:hypothetical protein
VKVEAAAAPAMPPEPSVVPVPTAKPKPTAAPAGNGSKDEQRFDFYKILPGQVDAVPA